MQYLSDLLRFLHKDAKNIRDYEYNFKKEVKSCIFFKKTLDIIQIECIIIA